MYNLLNVNVIVSIYKYKFYDSIEIKPKPTKYIYYIGVPCSRRFRIKKDVLVNISKQYFYNPDDIKRLFVRFSESKIMFFVKIVCS